MDETLHVGAAVVCLDGPAGKLHQVIIDDATDLVTHLVVETQPHFGVLVLVPRDRVASASHDLIQLRCRLAELREMGSFEAARFRRPDRAHPKLGYLPSQHRFSTLESMAASILWRLGASPSPMSRLERRLPEGGAIVGKDALVETAEGPFGQVEAMIIDPVSGRLGHLVVRYDRGGKSCTLVVPAPAVADITADTVRLRFTRAELVERFAAPAAGTPGVSADPEAC